MLAIQSTTTRRFVFNYGAVGANVITTPSPTNLTIPTPLVPPVTLSPIQATNGLFAHPGPPGNSNVVVWAPSMYAWNIHIHGSVRCISDPSSGRLWVNTENDAIPLSTSAPPSATSFLFIRS